MVLFFVYLTTLLFQWKQRKYFPLIYSVSPFLFTPFINAFPYKWICDHKPNLILIVNKTILSQVPLTGSFSSFRSWSKIVLSTAVSKINNELSNSDSDTNTFLICFSFSVFLLNLNLDWLSVISKTSREMLCYIGFKTLQNVSDWTLLTLFIWF